MTFKEQWMRDNPGKPFVVGKMCPAHFGYEDEPILDYRGRCLRATNCEDCWNREMPGTEEKPHILDSGERRQFETGAVRDIQEGKGRCDLMPLEVICELVKRPGEDPGSDYWFFWNINCFKNSGMTRYLYSAIHIVSVAFDTTFNMLLEVAKHFEEGAKKYGENNWQKGLPASCYIDSAMRHYIKWKEGWTDEPHLRAVIWNLMACIWECDFSPRAKGEGMPVAEEAPAHEVNSGRFYICNRKPCEVCHSDCHCTEVLNDAAVLELSDRDVRYEDCPIGLFMCDSDGVFLKTELVDAETGMNTAVHIGLGLSRKFEADDLVCPIKYPFEERERA